MECSIGGMLDQQFLSHSLRLDLPWIEQRHIKADEVLCITGYQDKFMLQRRRRDQAIRQAEVVAHQLLSGGQSTPALCDCLRYRQDAACKGED